ncbi:hypothetical protein ACTFOJ_05875 [Bacillus cereus group sp. MYBK77-1]|uniref:hypothetical protein n=1 Tax=unclassified Bacillus cereus group TaxID=2750818 RepID=UPI0032407BC0
MTLKEALKKITKENRMYFNYKFPDTRFNQTIQPKNEGEFLISVGRKTMNGFKAWEKTPEYTNLVALYLQSKIVNDIHTIYKVVREKALTGDEKQVKLLLTLNKEINSIIKAGAELSKVDEEPEDDGLII